MKRINWRHEARTLGVCFLLANLVNLAAILGYRTRWIELVTQIGWVLILTVSLYGGGVLLRTIFGGFRRRRRA